jgi:hypothetical protein
MPMPDLTAEEYDAIVHLLQKTIRESPFPLAPRLAPIRSALEKLATRAEVAPQPPPTS